MRSRRGAEPQAERPYRLAGRADSAGALVYGGHDQVHEGRVLHLVEVHLVLADQLVRPHDGSQVIGAQGAELLPQYRLALRVHAERVQHRVRLGRLFGPAGFCRPA